MYIKITTSKTNDYHIKNLNLQVYEDSNYCLDLRIHDTFENWKHTRSLDLGSIAAIYSNGTVISGKSIPSSIEDILCSRVFSDKLMSTELDNTSHLVYDHKSKTYVWLKISKEIEDFDSSRKFRGFELDLYPRTSPPAEILYTKCYSVYLKSDDFNSEQKAVSEICEDSLRNFDLDEFLVLHS